MRGPRNWGKFRTLWIKNDRFFFKKKKIHKKFSQHCTPTHMTDSMTYPHTTSHISLKILSVFRHSHNNMVRSAEERFAMERTATRGFGSKKIAAALGVPVSMAAEAACVMFSLHVSSHISRRVIGVPRLSVHGCNEERVRAAALDFCSQSPVFAAAAPSMSTWRRSTGQRSRWYVGKMMIFVGCCHISVTHK